MHQTTWGGYTLSMSSYIEHTLYFPPLGVMYSAFFAHRRIPVSHRGVADCHPHLLVSLYDPVEGHVVEELLEDDVREERLGSHALVQRRQRERCDAGRELGHRPDGQDGDGQGVLPTGNPEDTGRCYTLSHWSYVKRRLSNP